MDQKQIDLFFHSLSMIIESVSSSLPPHLFETPPPPDHWICIAEEDDVSTSRDFVAAVIESWTALLPIVPLDSVIDENLPEYEYEWHSLLIYAAFPLLVNIDFGI